VGVLQGLAVDPDRVRTELVAGCAELGAAEEIGALDASVGRLRACARSESPLAPDVAGGAVDAVQLWDGLELADLPLGLALFAGQVAGEAAAPLPKGERAQLPRQAR
jgi:hypothetical protein